MKVVKTKDGNRGFLTEEYGGRVRVRFFNESRAVVLSDTDVLRCDGIEAVWPSTKENPCLVVDSNGWSHKVSDVLANGFLTLVGGYVSFESAKEYGWRIMTPKEEVADRFGRGACKGWDQTPIKFEKREIKALTKKEAVDFLGKDVWFLFDAKAKKATLNAMYNNTKFPFGLCGTCARFVTAEDFTGCRVVDESENLIYEDNNE